jgi:prepilin-type N-terminal cleavage/methylation domain-containing protein
MKNKHKGFTLIELLIALTIFSIIASSIYYTFYTGLRLWSKENAAMMRNQKLRVFFDMVSMDVKNAIIYKDIKNEWSAGTMAFATIEPVSDKDGSRNEIVKVRYRFDKDAGKVLKACATVREGLDEKYAKENVIVDGLKDAGFQYCYKISEMDNGYEWRDAWEKTEKIPRGVKASLIFVRDQNGQEGGKLEKFIFAPMGELGTE